jgi:tripartite-type tricarboxylate transporter receptor subunit TctC
VLNAAPDGYTLFFALAANAGLPHLSKVSPYKSISELAPISMIGGSAQCLVVPASLPVKTMADFVAYAKGSAQPLMRGSNNIAEDMVAGQVTGAFDIKLERVPYKGASQMLPDLLQGRLQAAVMPAGFAAPSVQSGQLTMLGCSLPERLAALPSVPTFSESGVTAPPLITAHFLLGPSLLPAETIERLAAAVQRATQTADFKLTMNRLMIDGTARSPTQTLELMLRVEAQYVQYVRETGASID